MKTVMIEKKILQTIVTITIDSRLKRGEKTQAEWFSFLTIKSSIWNLKRFCIMIKIGGNQ